MLTKPVSVLNFPDLKEEFKKLWIEYSDKLFVADAAIYDLPRRGELNYPTQIGICRINPYNMHALVTDIQQRYNEFEQMQHLQDTIDLLKAKGQIVLQGPPGTGKTRMAEQIADRLAAKPAHRKLIQFHPAYAYEDFVRGIVADTTSAGSLRYQAENKVLAELAEQAAADSGNDYVLIIDEINRANLPAVLGELIYALENRGKEVDSVYGLGADKNRVLRLPSNLYIIGTMNTADRSVGHMDYAIRRRFAFVTVLPDANVVPEGPARRLFEQVQQLFETHMSPEFDMHDVQPGHSYFLVKDDSGLTLRQKLEYELRPLLHEYLRDGILLPTAKQQVNSLGA
ncbi:dynein-related subfamily AAA family protein [Hymenobacter chitinivorans DSM 11115]|uniref:Dynein-related subfamily AAA family protein n=1 Tax=Hymenobacter chitinivorans DSM 11115 TaxID=1121954 RepID=A0A2M9B9I7_9BACT|nr:dynein-related subfamily AAA family protein [Hymenobacter chitinivorans DSM 11115]